MMEPDERFIRAAGYLFTWRAPRAKPTKLEVWREDPATGARFWVAGVPCRSGARRVVYGTAMAVVAWLRALDVKPQATPQAQAVAESLAITRERLARCDRDPRLALCIDAWIKGRTSAA